ncbi:MAG: twin-arginine translocase subunit TatC [Pseudomonadota bacterium]
MKTKSGPAIVGAFVISAVVTPPDVISQLLLAVPMCLLYEVGLIAARLIGPRKDEDYRSPSDAELDRQLERKDGA